MWGEGLMMETWNEVVCWPGWHFFALRDRILAGAGPPIYRVDEPFEPCGEDELPICRMEVRDCTGEEGPEPEPDATAVLPVLFVQRDVDAPDAVEREAVWYRGVLELDGGGREVGLVGVVAVVGEAGGEVTCCMTKRMIWW
ncbi:hypothetical protein DL93DRAFT_2103070 [Clavulina sp. PMI_390]|nr:hypothetical protein DL93DRAFT_2103070 [Clavulina sp. PMI_390]